MTDANLSGAFLRGADLSDANLTGANLIGADLTDAYLKDAELAYTARKDAIFCNTTMTNGSVDNSGC